MDELPPGQRRIEGFPRFGTHFQQPAPAVPADPAIEIGGAVAEPFSVRLAELASLPRREMTSSFHCVSGWSATGLHWEGVAFETFYRQVLETAVAPGAGVTHVVFEGLDGYRSVAALEDALGADVLIAERLDGRPLGPDHGAPARLVSPSQYGFISTKHLCRIELHTSEPTESYEALPLFTRVSLRAGVTPHPRARVWHEERHRHLPAWVLRPVYRLLIRPIRYLSERPGR
jgi:DMSO/TMAO reductase YedYZ molybdopterin-dependent catalytic subunit